MYLNTRTVNNYFLDYEIPKYLKLTLYTKVLFFDNLLTALISGNDTKYENYYGENIPTFESVSGKSAIINTFESITLSF